MDKGTREEQLEVINSRIPFKPTAIVWTGGKSFHVYYRIDQTKGTDLNQWRDVVNSLAVSFDGDETLTDASQVLRIPESDYVNAQGVVTGRAVCEYLDSSVEYSLSEMVETLKQAGLFVPFVDKQADTTSNESKPLVYVRNESIREKIDRHIDSEIKVYESAGCECGCWKTREELMRDASGSLVSLDYTAALREWKKIDSVLCVPPTLTDRDYGEQAFKDRWTRAQNFKEIYERRPERDTDESNTPTMIEWANAQNEGGLMTFLRREYEPLDYVLLGAAKGDYGVIIAPPSSYKTTLTANLCIRLALGMPFEPFTIADPGAESMLHLPSNVAVAKPRKVAFFDFENTEVFMQQDLRRMVYSNALNEKDFEMLEANFLPIVDPQIRENGDPDSDETAR
jgi:hypothetical protein